MRRCLISVSMLLWVLCSVQSEALPQDGWVIRMNGLPSGVYNSAAMTDSLTIWLSGAGSIYLSTDLGLSWAEANRPGDSLGFPLGGGGHIAAWDTLNAVIATGVNGRIYRTSDGGETWQKVFEDPTVTTYFNNMEMVTDSVGFAIGDAPNGSSPPAIVQTNDAGWTWVPVVHNLPLGCYQWFGPTTDFISAQVGWSHQHLPGQATILLFKTTDGGVTWEELSDVYCHGMCFIDDSIGVRCPSGSLYLLRTTDGGLSWESTGENGFWVVASPDGGRLWGLGGQSLQASDDSGATWYEQTLPFRPMDFPPQNGSFYSKDIGVLVGRKVLVTTTGGNEVVDVEVDNQVPRTYMLSQNYPNPFNPSTTINFGLPHAGFVTLKVYNVLGEAVATLISGDHAAGTFKATWDASRLPSGVYFYRLTAGEYVQTKKMVLMR